MWAKEDYGNGFMTSMLNAKSWRSLGRNDFRWKELVLECPMA